MLHLEVLLIVVILIDSIFCVLFVEHAESDCFFCFTNLMSEIRDFFIKTLDEADCGINNMMSKLLTQLKNNDLEVWLRFQQQELRPQYYSFRYVHNIVFGILLLIKKCLIILLV